MGVGEVSGDCLLVCPATLPVSEGDPVSGMTTTQREQGFSLALPLLEPADHSIGLRRLN